MAMLWLQLLRGKNKVPARRGGTRLTLERLEDRTVPSTLIPVTNRTDLVFDAGRNLLYIPTSAGTIERYDVAAQALLTPWTVGTALNGADITPDGNFLYVTENQTSGGVGTIHKVDLNNNGAVTNLSYSLTSLESGGFDIAIANNGLALSM